jgi:hypothetical protein
MTNDQRPEQCSFTFGPLLSCDTDASYTIVGTEDGEPVDLAYCRDHLVEYVRLTVDLDVHITYRRAGWAGDL